MEKEISPEQHAAIQEDLAKLAESYGLTLSEVARIASTMGEQQTAPEAEDEESQRSKAMSRLHMLAGQRWGGFADIYPVMRENNEEDRQKWKEFETNKIAEMIEQAETLGFTPGVQISVQRSNGEVENDWVLQNYNPEDQTVTVVKDTDKGHLIKGVDLRSFFNSNFGFDFNHNQ
jgi:hypothetical protein